MKILAFRLPEFQKKIDSFNRKAKKWNLPLVAVKEVSRFTEEYKTGFDEVSYREFVELEITGDIPKISGWAVHSRIEPTGQNGMNFVFTAPKFNPEPRLRETDMVCEHCNHKRKRSLVYLLQNMETGEQKLVGKSCVKDFIPSAGVENLLSYMSSFPTVDNIDNDNLPREAWVYPVKLLIAESLILIKRDGFISGKAAKEHNQSSAQENTILPTSHWLAEPKPKNREELYPQSMIAEVTDNGTVQAVIDFVMSKDATTNDFIYNLHVSMSLQYVGWKMFGYIAAAVNMYLKSLEDAVAKKVEADRKAERSNEFIGEVGVRMDFLNLTVKRENVIQGEWGNTYIYAFEDAAGNDLVWFASKSMFDVGNVVNVKASVKGHNVYNGRNQTVITRAKVID